MISLLHNNIWSGPLVLLVSSVDSRCCIPETVNVVLGIYGNELPELTIGGICVRFSLVKTVVI